MTNFKDNIYFLSIDSERYQEALKRHSELMNEALEEIDEYCKKNAWLNEIHLFCKGWSRETLNEWKGAAAFKIEVRLFMNVEQYVHTYTNGNIDKDFP